MGVRRAGIAGGMDRVLMGSKGMGWEGTGKVYLRSMMWARRVRWELAGVGKGSLVNFSVVWLASCVAGRLERCSGGLEGSGRDRSLCCGSRLQMDELGVMEAEARAVVFGSPASRVGGGMLTV